MIREKLLTCVTSGLIPPIDCYVILLLVLRKGLALQLPMSRARCTHVSVLFLADVVLMRQACVCRLSSVRNVLCLNGAA